MDTNIYIAAAASAALERARATLEECERVSAEAEQAAAVAAQEYSTEVSILLITRCSISHRVALTYLIVEQAGCREEGAL